MRTLNRLGRLYDANEDDSPFVSIADFFSLISLAFIYLAVVFGSPMAKDLEVEVAQAAAPGSGQVTARDYTTAYVALIPQRNGVILRVIPAFSARASEHKIGFPMTDVSPAADWLLKTLANTSHPKKVILFLPDDEKRPQAHSLFIELSRKLEQNYNVVLVM